MAEIKLTLQYAKIAEFLAANDSQRQSLFLNSSIVKRTSRLIYIVRSAIERQYLKTIPATGSLGIAGVGSVGDIIEVIVDDPIYGEILIGIYTITSGDTTQNILATNVAASINLFGYSAASVTNVVGVVAPVNLGSSINGISMSVTYIPAFIPENLPGFWAGYASDSGVTVSGSDVLSWANIGGDASKDLAAFAGSPTLVPNVLNGLPVLNTDGVTGRLLGTNLPQITDCTIYMVALQKAGDTSNGLFIGSGNDLNISRDGGGNDIVGRTANPSQNVPVNVLNDVFYSIRLSGDLTTQNICKNNGTPTSGSRTHTTITPTNLNVFYDGTGFVSSKQIAAIWIYLATHTTDQKNSMESYLNSKYNLY